MRASIEAHHATAQRSGARIVHACGFDSVPSDLGVLLLARTAARHGLGGLTDTRYVLTGGRGGVGGGTIESMRGQVDRMVGDPAARAVVADPYALSPDRAAEPDRSSARESTLGPDEDPAAGGRGRRRRGLSWDAEAGRWLAPFVMGPVNTRVVRRSNALSGWSYGRGFRYHEHVGVPGRLLGALGAGALTAGTGALALGMAVPPTRWLMDRVLPAVGTGPDEASREAGYFSVRLYARTTSGQTVQVRVRSQGDPAYVSTARMLAESALALALDRDRLPDRAGVLTPATAMGDVLVGRLRAAGMTLRAL